MTCRHSSIGVGTPCHSASRTLSWILQSAALLILAITAAASGSTDTVVIDVRKVLVSHFDGWGTSLCWWANVVGGFANREEYADLAFTQLGLNIVRYNIGGGENPLRANPMEFRARMAGFEPEPGKWDWNADANQRWMLRSAVAHGADRVVAFANSPPYWMTSSGSVTGSVNGLDDNLRRDAEASFAEYLATVVGQLTILDNVKFDLVTPMNEPAARWWKQGNHQEGAHMSIVQQERVIELLRQALDRHDVKAGIAASDDNDERSALKSVSSYGRKILGHVSYITTHTHFANDSTALRRFAEKTAKPLWVSEYGDGEPSGLRMALRIRDDIAEMHARAWIYWQFADNAPAWGLVVNRLDGRDASYRPTRKFYVMAQFSRFIRPGSRIVQIGDDRSLAAFDQTKRQLIIVSINDGAISRTVTYRPKGLVMEAGEVSAYRTSQQEEVAAQPPIQFDNGTFTATLPAQSVTTFIVASAGIAG